MAYTSVFGGFAVQPSQVSYERYVVTTEDIVLEWPFAGIDTQDVVAWIMDIEANGEDFGGSLILPPATQASPGQPLLISNVGERPIALLDSEGNEIVLTTAGTSWYVYLVDNSTPAGTWRTVAFGATTSEANAAALAGFGLSAFSGRLNVNMPIKTIAGNYIVTAQDRASLLVTNALTGAITITLPGSVLASNGFFVSINNEGTGNVTVATNNGWPIDGQETFILNPSDSVTLVSTGSSGNAVYSLGYGHALQYITRVEEIDLTDQVSPYTLSAEQSSFVILSFIGVLTDAFEVRIPGVANQYFVYNGTTGDFNLTFKVVGSPSSVNIPQGERLIIYSDGVNAYSAPTIAVPSDFRFADGTEGAPSITFSSQPTDGIYHPEDGVLGFTVNGTATSFMDAGGIYVNQLGDVNAPPYSFDGRRSSGMYFADGDLALCLCTEGLKTLEVKSDKFSIFADDKLTFTAEPTLTSIYIDEILTVSVNATALTSTLPFYAPNGTQAAPAFSFSNKTNTGWYWADPLLTASVNNTVALQLSPTQIRAATLGTNTAPVFSFTGALGTGVYAATNATLDLASLGVRRASFGTVSQFFFPLQTINGDATTPAYAFTASTNSGFYWVNSPTQTLHTTINGTSRYQMTASNLNTSGASYQREGLPIFSLMRIMG